MLQRQFGGRLRVPANHAVFQLPGYRNRRGKFQSKLSKVFLAGARLGDTEDLDAAMLGARTIAACHRDKSRYNAASARSRPGAERTAVSLETAGPNGPASRVPAFLRTFEPFPKGTRGLAPERAIP